MSDGPTVSRSEKTRRSRFARIDNAALQDDRLSFRARGVLAYVLSRPDSWTHSADRLSAASCDGVDAIRGALRELEAAGYAELRRVRSSRGSVVHRWYFNETPSAKNPDSLGASKTRDLKDTVEKPDGEKAHGFKGDGGVALSETTEGDTTQVETTERKTTEGEKAPAPLTCPWFGFTDLPENLRTFAVDKFGNETLAADAVLEVLGRKFRFRDTQPNLAAWCAALRSEIADTANVRAKGRGFAQQHTYAGVTSKVGDSTQRSTAAEPQPVAEPADWRELLPTDDDDRASFAAYTWTSIPAFYQQRIVAKIAAISAGGEAA